MMTPFAKAFGVSTNPGQSQSQFNFDLPGPHQLQCCGTRTEPLAAVLWNGGISFGGVVAFLFAELIALPIINIYRKYYGMRMAAPLLGLFCVAMAAAGYLVEALFGLAGLVPQQRRALVLEASVQ
jgi:hypothetical protein